MDQSFVEIRVCDGIAERTGVQFDRTAVRRSASCCSSLVELHRKVRAAGDGLFYLPVLRWPADTEQFDVLKKWVVMSSIPKVLHVPVTEP